MLKALEQSCKFKHFAYYNFAALVVCIFHRDVEKMKVSYKITQTDTSTWKKQKLYHWHSCTLCISQWWRNEATSQTKQQLGQFSLAKTQNNWWICKYSLKATKSHGFKKVARYIPRRCCSISAAIKPNKWFYISPRHCGDMTDKKAAWCHFKQSYTHHHHFTLNGWILVVYNTAQLL